MYLVHESVRKYVTILWHYPGREWSGWAIQLALPHMLPLVIINIHGPFEKAQQHAMDKWLGTFNRVDILMGDFNDKIWGESHKPIWWWHTKLTNGTLQDPAMAVAEDISPASLITHNRGRRLNAMLVSANAWRMCTPEAYYTLDYSNAGDHFGVTMVTHNPLQESPPPLQGYGPVAHWPHSLFYKFKRHMTQWSKAHPHTDCAPVARADMILNEIMQFVIQHPRKNLRSTPGNNHYVVPSLPTHAPHTHYMTGRHTWGTRK